MKKKILSLVLTLCMLLGMFPFVVGTSALAVSETDGKVHLTTAEDLLALMGDTSLWNKDIVLENDIDMTGKTGQTPIGNATTAFTGSFIGVKKADGTNPEIKGLDIKTTAATNRWGLIGYATGNVTVKNITVSGEISSAGGGVAGIVGAMVGGNLVIEDCVNYCTVTSTNAAASRAGGILGIAQNAGVSVRNCVNYGAISGVVHAGGVVGRFETTTGKTGFTMEVVGCINNGAVSSSGAASEFDKDNGVGGIIGSAVDRGGITMTISRCLNTGDVNGKTCVGGILGQPANMTTPDLSTGAHVIKVTDCMNTGNITASGMYAGGIVGYLKDPKYIIYVDRVYNTGAVSATQYGLAVFGVPRKSVIKNAYYSNGPEDTTAVSVTPASAFAENKELFPGLANSEAWIVTNAGPVLASTHNHDFVGGVCDTCGETLATHTPDYVWKFDGTNYYYTCADEGCGIVLHTQTEAPTLYVDAYTKASTLVGDDANDGLTKATAVLTVEEAFRRLADVGGTVCFSDRYYVSSAIDFPANSKKITVTSDPKTGFYFEKSNLRLFINGDVEFRNMFFYADKAANDAARLIVFVCNWHNVTFGEGLATSVSAYIFAGTESAADDTDAQTQDLVFFGVNQVVMTGTTGDNLSAARCFYDNIVLGSRTTATSVANVTANKEIQARFYDYTADPYVFSPKVGTLRCATTAQSANANVQGCETRVYLNGGTTVGKLATGDKNMRTGAAALDKLLVALNGNTSTVTDMLCFFNVKQLVFSASHTLRTAAIPQRLVASFSEAYTADGTESLVASYGTHSFAADTGMADGLKAGVNYSAYYEGRVTVNLTDECTWTDTNANGTYAKTCSCGRTETVLSLAFGSATATSTGSTVRFIAEMTLGERAAVEKYGMLITALADQTAGSGSFADDKFAFAEGTDVTAAAAGKLRFAADLTGIPAGKGDTPIYAWAYVKLAGVDDLVILPFTPVTTNGLNTK